jgi:uncharacterized protein YhaN
MQPVDQAAERVAAFLEAFADDDHTQGAISTLRSEGLRLTVADLRTALDRLRELEAEQQRTQTAIERKDRLLRRLEEQRDKESARATRLEGNLSAVRGWARSNLETLDAAQRDWRRSSENAAKMDVLDDLTRVLDHLATIPRDGTPGAASSAADGESGA